MTRTKTARAFLCALIIFALTFGILPVSSAYAASVSFSDISESEYYYTAITEMSGQGVINGYDDGSFRPQSFVKHSEALKLVCAMAGVSYSGYSGSTSPWYSDVLAWAKDNSIVSSDIDPEAYATREQICGYIAAVYKLSLQTETNAFSDTDSKVANTLFDYGVINGIPNDDGTVSFGGSQNVKRGDTALMLYRLSQKVQKPDWSEEFRLDKSHYQVARPQDFDSYDDYVQMWDYMLVNADLKDSFQIKGTFTKSEISELLNDVQNSYYFSAFDYIEYASFLNQWGVSVSYTYSRTGEYYNPVFVLELSSGEGLSSEAVLNEISAFNSACDQIVTQLFASGELTTSMTVKEKALVLYRYVAYHTQYDQSLTYYNGYDAAVLGTAVCQGYTAMYNYLCNISGIQMECMTGRTDGANHAWSRILYDGVYYNVDTTWSDPIPDTPNYCNEKWFWLTDNEMKTGADARTFDIDTLVYG